MTTITIKMQARGVLTLPKKIRTRMGIDTGDIVELAERDGKIFIEPMSHIDAELRKDVRQALEDLRTGRASPAFSSVREFKAYMKAKSTRLRG